MGSVSELKFWALATAEGVLIARRDGFAFWTKEAAARHAAEIVGASGAPCYVLEAVQLVRPAALAIHIDLAA